MILELSILSFIPSLDTHHSVPIVIFLDFPTIYSRNVIFIFPKSYQKGARQVYIHTYINVFSLFKISLETINKKSFYLWTYFLKTLACTKAYLDFAQITLILPLELSNLGPKSSMLLASCMLRNPIPPLTKKLFRPLFNSSIVDARMVWVVRLHFAKHHFQETRYPDCRLLSIINKC